MFELNKLIRINIRDLQPYSSARDEYDLTEGVFLDANENPFGTANRYPDAKQNELKNRLCELKKIKINQLFIGNGSDEIIDLCFRVFCEPKVDEALVFVPTYGMYEVAAAIQDVKLNRIDLNADFQIDFSDTSWLKNEKLKLIFICSPNNPTGNKIDFIDKILNHANAIVIVDEAYIDFSEIESWNRKVNQYPNLIVLQTLSKAWGLASARIGIAIANETIINLLNKVKPPYNVSTPNQKLALQVLSEIEIFENNKKTILSERKIMAAELMKFSFVKEVYPSDANFILIEVTDADSVYNQLARKQMIVRNRNKIIPNTIRITIGTPEENKQLLEMLNQIEL